MRTSVFIALVVLWLIFPFGQFAVFRMQGGVDILATDVLVGVVAILVFAVSGWRKLRGSGGLFETWLVLLLVLGFSPWLNPLKLDGFGVITSLLYWLRWAAASGLIFISGSVAENKRMGIVKLMLVGGVGLACSGLAQYVIFPYLGPLVSQGWDPHLYRVVGSLLDPGFAGIIFVGVLLMLCSMRFELGLTGQQWALVMGLVSVELLLTYSRATYLAFLTGFGVLALRRRSFGWYAKLVILFLVAVVLLPRPAGEGVRLERENSVAARIENWSHALKIFEMYPALGVGFNSYRYAQAKFGFVTEDGNHAAAGSDSSLLLILATSGLVGVVVFGWFIYRVLIFVFGGDGVFREVAVTTLAAVSVHFWFLNSLFYSWVLVWVATVVGLSNGWKRK